MNLFINFYDLAATKLIKGVTYKGGMTKNMNSEPISKILPVGNQSGIRFKGNIERPDVVVLYSNFNETEWPDVIENDLLTYYGDNRSSKFDIHDRQGNKVLRSIFLNYYSSGGVSFPNIFLFSKGNEGYDRVFLGLLRPGHVSLKKHEELLAVWTNKNDNNFQNYKASFTLLPVEIIERNEFIKQY